MVDNAGALLAQMTRRSAVEKAERRTPLPRHRSRPAFALTLPWDQAPGRRAVFWIARGREGGNTTLIKDFGPPLIFVLSERARGSMTLESRSSASGSDRRDQPLSSFFPAIDAAVSSFMAAYDVEWEDWEVES